jgi:hypothetical protein
MQERIDAIYAAVPATNDEAVREAGAMTARGLLALLTTLRSTITAFDRRIAELVAAHPEPGAGPVLVPRLLVAFGTRRERYDSALQMQSATAGSPPSRRLATKPHGSISALHAPSFYARRFTSLPVTRSGHASGPGLTTSTCETTKKSPTSGGSRARLQMDSHRLSMLEGR